MVSVPPPVPSTDEWVLIGATFALRESPIEREIEVEHKRLCYLVLGCVPPRDWTGYSRVQLGERYGELQLFARQATGVDVLLQTVKGLDAAVRLYNRLNLIGAYTVAEPSERAAALDRLAEAYYRASPIDGALHYARAIEMWIRNSPNASEEEKSFAKDDRKNLEGLAMLYEARGRTVTTEAERELPSSFQDMTMSTNNPETTKAPARGNKAITAEVVQELWKGVESGGRLPWQTPYVSVPQINGFTGKRYRGINRLVLAQRLDDLGGSDDNRWFSRGQIMGRQKQAWAAHKRDVEAGVVAADSKPNVMFMRKGQLAVRVIFAGKVTPKAVPGGKAISLQDMKGGKSLADQIADAMYGQTATRSRDPYFVLKKYPVWHASQLQNCPPVPARTRSYAPSEGFNVARDALTDLVKRMGAIVTENPSAVPNMVSLNKRIITPPAANFTNEYAYLSVLAHEIAHLTGTSDLLARRFVVACESGEAAMLARDNPDQYERLRAQEEMVAEISATLMMSCLGHPYDFDADQEIGHQHASYVAHYLEIVRDDPTAFSVACALAERVVSFAIQTSPLFCLAAEESGHYVPAGELELDAQAAKESQLSEEMFELDLADLDIDGADAFLPLTSEDFDNLGAGNPPSRGAQDADATLRDLGF